MPPDLQDLDAASVIGGIPVLGIAIALVGAVFLALGAQTQHRGVEIVEARHGNGEKSGLSARQILRLLATPWWALGTVLLGLAILFQLTSLAFAPLIVVQPLGVVALVITTVVNTRVANVHLNRKARRAIAFCVLGVALFVTVAAFVATEHPVDRQQLIIILSLLGGVLLVLGAAFVLLRKRTGALFYILSAGVLYGFVATLAKVVINRVGNLIAGVSSGGEWLTIACVVALIAATALGGYFVQTAYSVGSPDLVVAGLTVVDPLVAVTIGIAVLGEASDAPWWAILVWVPAAALAVYGVFQLERHHPQNHRLTAPSSGAAAEPHPGD